MLGTRPRLIRHRVNFKVCVVDVCLFIPDLGRARFEVWTIERWINEAEETFGFVVNV